MYLKWKSLHPPKRCIFFTNKEVTEDAPLKLSFGNDVNMLEFKFLQQRKKMRITMICTILSIFSPTDIEVSADTSEKACTLIAEMLLRERSKVRKLTMP